MTDPEFPTPPECTCDDHELLRLGLEGRQTPPCPRHRPETSSPALNSASLTETLRSLLDAEPTTTTQGATE